MSCHSFGGSLPVLPAAGIDNKGMFRKRISQTIGHQVAGHRPQPLVHIVDILIRIEQIPIIHSTHNKTMELVIQVVKRTIWNFCMI